MCGICGIVSLDPERRVEREAVQPMAELLRHRGPDDSGFYCDGPVALAHLRLSVIDLAGGHQPMVSGEGDRAIVFNGEIYNYQDLRRYQSESDLRTNSDTEVLLNSVDFDDLAWLDRLNGMFAFVWWNRAKRQLVLARDRVGIKPLYYAEANGYLVFASEIKAILGSGLIDRELNTAAVPEYLAYRNVAGSETLFAGIYEIPPGHVMRLDLGQGTRRLDRFWMDGDLTSSSGDLFPNVDNLTLETALHDAIRYRLIADVPLGTYNSGGVDSSVISRLVRDQNCDGDLHTFSVGFGEAEFDESVYAEAVAERIGSQHHKLMIDAEQYASYFERTIWHLDEPLHHAHTVPLMKLSALAKEYVTVVLTGEGADELFAGYPRYQIPVLSRWFENVPDALVKSCHALCSTVGLRRVAKLLEVAGDPVESVLEQCRFASRADLNRVGIGAGVGSYRASLWQDIAGRGLPFLEQVLAFDRGSYMPSLLQRLDRTTMASGLEARVPFLDHRLIRWSQGLPRSQKLTPGRDNKIVLKKLALQHFPREMIYRRKMGFGVPISAWLRDDRGLGGFLDVLTDTTFRERGLFDATTVAQLVDDHRQGKRDHGELLWPMMNLEMWARMFIDELNEPKRSET